MESLYESVQVFLRFHTIDRFGHSLCNSYTSLSNYEQVYKQKDLNPVRWISYDPEPYRIDCDLQ